jgi:hypothetical protein
MTSLYGIKPEPMPLKHQVTMGILYLSAQAQINGKTVFVGPPLSPNQMQEHLPGYYAKQDVMLTISFIEETEQILYQLVERDVEEALVAFVEPLKKVDLIKGSAGTSFVPVSKLKRIKIIEQIEKSV